MDAYEKKLKQVKQETKEEKQDKIREHYYIDYCNQCRAGLGGETESCHHPWFCYFDDGIVQGLMNKIYKLNDFKREWGFLPAREQEEYKRLQNLKYELVKARAWKKG